MRNPLLTGIVLFAASLTHAAPVDSTSLQPKEEASLIRHFNQQLDSIDKKIVYYTGHISLAEGNIDLIVPEGFLFIDAEQARFILEELWGNIPDMDVAGMLVRKGFRATRLENDHSFVISYSGIGHISDNTGKDLDHDELLHTLQRNMEKGNQTRVELGYNTMTVTGWVMVPYYDEYKKALYWASKINANGSDEEILNYNLRLLGKNGVIKINAVATMDQLAAIKQELPAIISQTRFAEGGTFADFKEGQEQPSEWSLKEMVAGEKRSNGIFAAFKWMGILVFIAGLSTAYFRFSKRKMEKALA